MLISSNIKVDLLLDLKNYLQNVSSETVFSQGRRGYIITVELIYGEKYKIVYGVYNADKYKIDIQKLRNALKSGKKFREKFVDLK